MNSDLETSDNETEEQINETIIKLGPIESINYAVRKLRKNGKATPGGWEEFIRYRELGSDPWLAANLPRSPLTGSSKLYKDVMYYSYGMEPVRWMAYYSTILEKQRQYKWSALQLGVVLATYIKGEMMQTLTNELRDDKIYNIYQLLATLDKWDLSQEKCRKSCKDVWTKRVQTSSENVATYACELQYLANLMYPGDKTKTFQEKLMEKFVKGLHKKYRTTQQVLAATMDEFVYFRDMVRKAVRLEKYYEKEENDIEAIGNALSRARSETYGVGKGESNRFEMDLGGIYGIEDYELSLSETEEIDLVQENQSDQGKEPVKEKKTKSKQRPRSVPQCFNCKKKGHMRFDCRWKPQKGKEKLYITPMQSQEIENRRLAYLKNHQLKIGDLINGQKIEPRKESISIVQEWGQLKPSEITK
jgi:hypothetical protein